MPWGVPRGCWGQGLDLGTPRGQCREGGQRHWTPLAMSEPRTEGWPTDAILRSEEQGGHGRITTKASVMYAELNECGRRHGGGPTPLHTAKLPLAQ